MLPTCDNFSDLQEPPGCPRNQVPRVDKGMLSSHRVMPSRPAPHCFAHGTDPERDPACPPLSPPSEACSFDHGPGMSARLLSHLEQFPPEGFLMHRGFLPSGPKPGGASLCVNAALPASLPSFHCFQQPLWRPLRALPEQVQGTESPHLGLVTLPSPSSPVCSQKTPSVP